MTKSSFALNFALKFFVATALLISIGYFLEVELPSVLGLLLTFFIFAWSCQVYLEKNGIEQPVQVKQHLVFIGFGISIVPQLLLLALMLWVAELPFWILLIATGLGGVFTYAALHFGFGMAKNMLLKRELQKAKSTN